MATLPWAVPVEADAFFLRFHGRLICFALLFLRTLCHRPAPLFLLPLRPLAGAAQGLAFF